VETSTLFTEYYKTFKDLRKKHPQEKRPPDVAFIKICLRLTSLLYRTLPQDRKYIKEIWKGLGLPWGEDLPPDFSKLRRGLDSPPLVFFPHGHQEEIVDLWIATIFSAWGNFKELELIKFLTWRDTQKDSEELLRSVRSLLSRHGVDGVETKLAAPPYYASFRMTKEAIEDLSLLLRKLS